MALTYPNYSPRPSTGGTQKPQLGGGGGQQNDPNQSLPSTGAGGYTYDAKTGSWVKQPAVDQTPQWMKNYSALSGLGMFNSSGPWGAGGGATIPSPSAPPTVQAPANMERIAAGPTPAQIGNIQGPDRTAANAAIFARAKDQVGQTSRGALTGLAGAMAGRGILGSGVEGRGIQSVINSGQGQLGDVTRQNAITDADISEQNALASYQGDITQRGQNIGLLDSQRGQDVTQRGQDVSSQQNALNSLITQRGQDVGLTGQGYQGQIAQRGQDLDQQRFNQQRQQAAIQALFRTGMY